MSTIQSILDQTSHRPFALPVGTWSYYQEWNRALFMHWEVPYSALRSCVPASFEIDTFEGKCYVSIVAFTMEQIRPRLLPAVGIVSNFEEINVRTYLIKDGKQGVYFLNIEAGNAFSAWLAKALSGLPYEKAAIQRTATDYHSINRAKQFRLDASFEILDQVTEKTALERWLTERYCLYLNENHTDYRFDIHHLEWPIHAVKLNHLETDYRFGQLNFKGITPNFIQYSPGVKVMAWQREKL